MIEAQIALEAKLADVRELEAQVCYAHIQLAERELDTDAGALSARNPKNRKAT